MIDGSVSKIHCINMVSTIIKPKDCKERLSNKKKVSHRKSSKSTKSVKIDLKVDASVNSDIVVKVNFRNNTRRTTFSEAAFECPNPACHLIVKRYRNLFNHFSDKCEWAGYERFEWWCSDCNIPRYWASGADLIKHLYSYHGQSATNWPKDGSFPKMFLTFRCAPEGFNRLELLEHNKQFFGTQKQTDLWKVEVDNYRITGDYEEFYTRPDVGCESKNKRLAVNRTYGIKERPSRAKKSVHDAFVLGLAEEMVELIFQNFKHPAQVLLLKCQIGSDPINNIEGVSSRAAFLVGQNELAHKAALEKKDDEIIKLNKKITAMRRFQSKEMKKLRLECAAKVKHEKELAQSQIPFFALSLLDDAAKRKIAVASLTTSKSNNSSEMSTSEVIDID